MRRFGDGIAVFAHGCQMHGDRLFHAAASLRNRGARGDAAWGIRGVGAEAGGRVFEENQVLGHKRSACLHNGDGTRSHRRLVRPLNTRNSTAFDD